MITRKRVRVSEGVEPETKSLDSNDVDVCDLVGIVDCTQPASYEQISPESEDSTELDLEDFLSVDDVNWNFDQEGLSSIFDMGKTGSSDVSSTVANRGMADQDPDMDEPFSFPKRSGGVKRTQECKRSLPGRVNKNAIAARMNRLKKKEYVNGLEKKVTTFASENMSLRQENSHLVKRVEELEDETRYLRAVLANESMLAQLLSRLSGVNGMKLSTSLFQESSKNDHDYALPRKRVKVEEKDTSGGICLHVDKNHLSVEFCTKCAESASTSLKM